MTKVKQVESEALRKQYTASKEEIVQLRDVHEKQKQDLHSAQDQIRYLERMVT